MPIFVRHAAALAAGLLLSACGAGAGDGAAPPDTAAATRPADTAGAQAAPAEPAALSASGFGPAQFGATPEEANAALGGNIRLGTDAAPCHVLDIRGMDGVRLMVVDGRVVRADLEGPRVATDRGARVGDSEARVRALHGDLRSMPHKYTKGKYLVALPLAPADTMRRLVFETDSAGTVTAIRGGLFPQVEWVERCG